MSFHLVVTRPFGAFKVGQVILDPEQVQTIGQGPHHRSVVRVYEGATHLGMPDEVLASDNAIPSAPASEFAEPKFDRGPGEA